MTTQDKEVEDIVLITPDEDAAGDISKRFLQADQVSDRWGLNMLLTGHAGVGKTLLASTAQDSDNGKDVFIVDIDSGVRTVSDRNDVTVFVPDGWDDVIDVTDWLETEKHDYRTIIYDSLSDGQVMALRWVLQTAKDPEWPSLYDRGKVNAQVVGLVRKTRQWSLNRGWNVIFTTRLKEAKNDQTGQITERPLLSPAALDMVTGAVDVIGILEIDSEGERRLIFKGSDRQTAKFRAPRGFNIPDRIDSPSMSDVLALSNKKLTKSKNGGKKK